MAEEAHPHDVEETDEQAAQTAESRKVQDTWEDQLLHLAGDRLFREWLYYLLYSACKMMSRDVILNRQMADEAKGRADLAKELHATLSMGNRRAYFAMLDENDPAMAEDNDA